MMLLRSFQQLEVNGGPTLLPLLLEAALLFYALGYRSMLLRRGSTATVETMYTGAAPKPATLLGQAVTALQVRQSPHASLALQMWLADFTHQAQARAVLIRSLVATAPLLGLLGTVAGMVETFDAMASAQLFAQSGGIAGGISHALVSTQLGLLVAIPGMLLGRVLDTRERRLVHDLERLSAFAQRWLP